MRDAVGLVERERNGLQWSGALVVGTKGRMVADRPQCDILPAARRSVPGIEKERPQTVDASLGHEAEWLAACRGGRPAWANFDYAAALNEFLMLGNVATQCEAPLEFEPASMQITNNPPPERC